MSDHVESLREHGYAVVRDVFPAAEMAEIAGEAASVYEQAMTHPCSYRDKNLQFELVRDPETGARFVIQAYWFAWINPRLEALRRDPRVFALLEPLLGRDIKQIANQIHWKPPGAPFATYRYHQDLRFRERPELFGDLIGGSVTMGLAVDPQNAENGGLQVYPGSHRMGYLGLSEDGTIMKGRNDEAAFKAAGLDPAELVQLDLAPGDAVLWTLLTVHGSGWNRSANDRCFMLNSYMAAAESPHRGEWTFRSGQGVALSGEPEICKYEALRERPGPFYMEQDWTGTGAAGLPAGQTGLSE